MGSQLKIRLIGDTAKLGRIPAADVARLLLGAERVLARAAGHARGRKLANRGRWGRVVEEAVHLRLTKITSGSVTAVLAFPEAPAEALTLGLDAASLTDEAVRAAIATLTKPEHPAYRDVARAVVQWGDDLGIGSRYPKVVLQHNVAGVQQRAELTPLIQERLRVAVNAPIPSREDEVVGRLVEADFETDKAHLRTVAGDRIEVSFDTEWEDLIQEALRQEASVVGEVSYDPSTSKAQSVRLRRLTRGEQLHAGLIPGDFAETRGIHQIASELNVKPFESVDSFAMDEVPDDEMEAFIAALGQ